MRDQAAVLDTKEGELWKSPGKKKIKGERI